MCRAPSSGTSSQAPILIRRRCSVERAGAERRACALVVAAVPARADLLRRRAGATRRSTSIQPRAATCGAISSGPAAPWACLSSGPSHFRSRACSPRVWRSRLPATRAPIFHAGSSRRIRSRLGDRRSRDARRTARRMRRRSGDGARARRKRGEQGSAQGRMRPRYGDRNHRRAMSRDRRWRNLLGQRPARIRARFGRGRPRR